MFQVNAPITSVCLHPNQAELIVADLSGCINIWDLKTDKTEQLVRYECFVVEATVVKICCIC